MTDPTLPLTPDPSERAAKAEQRGHARGTVRYVARPSLSEGPAEVRDVTARGAALVVARDPGPVLLLRLPCRPEGVGPACLAHVAHAERRPDGRWLVVCRFTPPLPDEGLAHLLA